MAHQLHPRGSAEADTSRENIELLDQHTTTSSFLNLETHQPEAIAGHEEFSRSSHDLDPRQCGNTSVRDQNEAEVSTRGHSPSISEGPLSRSQGSVLWRGPPFTSLVWEILGVILSICFLGTSEFPRKFAAWMIIYITTNNQKVLGAFVASLQGKFESKWSNQVVQVTKIAPSVWPVVFSGILGNAIRALADWKVERGIPLLV
jgi:hypothetical protein